MKLDVGISLSFPKYVPAASPNLVGYGSRPGVPPNLNRLQLCWGCEIRGGSHMFGKFHVAPPGTPKLFRAQLLPSSGHHPRISSGRLPLGFHTFGRIPRPIIPAGLATEITRLLRKTQMEKYSAVSRTGIWSCRRATGRNWDLPPNCNAAQDPGS